MNKYCTYKVPMGEIKVVYSDKGVVNVMLPYDEDREAVEAEFEENERIRKYFDDYFGGREPERLELDVKVTEFQKKVFDLLLDTRMGTILTYGDIAKLINCGSNQAIGQALKRNPVPIIVACHRVVGRGWDGGFDGETSGVKMEFKKFLIDHEKNGRS